jgi:two-component system, OmpR family, response regulator ChvI
MWPSKKKILVVDDEPDITLTLLAILQEGGYEVVSFNDPLLALQSFKPQYYDLLILDIKMPKMNGFELYQKLKEKDSQAKVCFLTAVSEFRGYEQYKKDVSPKPHERYFVAKPISPDDLLRKINEMLANNNYNYDLNT